MGFGNMNKAEGWRDWFSNCANRNSAFMHLPVLKCMVCPLFIWTSEWANTAV